MRRARVVVAHRAPDSQSDRPPMRLARGETVMLGDRDADWPQFVWAVPAGGVGGWVPAALFQTQHVDTQDVDATQGPATALADYDTRELTAGADEILGLHHELAQWWWAENSRGAQGWIPARAIEIID